MKFKVGDKVKCVKKDTCFYESGKIYQIKGINDDGEGYYELTSNNKDSYLLPEFLIESFEKVEDYQNKHMQVCERLNSIYVSKNKDYGNSFGRQYQEYGITSSVIRLDDKMRRLKQITKPDVIIEVEDETIEDTLLDLANYAILTLMELEGQDE